MTSDDNMPTEFLIPPKPPASPICVLDLPDSTIVRLMKKEVIVLEAEAIHLDMDLAKSQDGVADISSDEGKAQWVSRFRSMLSAHSINGYKFSFTEAWFVALATQKIMADMKKKLDGLESLLGAIG